MFIESSPHPVLLAGIEDTLAQGVGDCAGGVVAVPTLGRDDGGLGRFWTSVGQAHVAVWGWIGGGVRTRVGGGWSCPRMRFSGGGFG